jgi:hypothetical protein
MLSVLGHNKQFLMTDPGSLSVRSTLYLITQFSRTTPSGVSLYQAVIRYNASVVRGTTTSDFVALQYGGCVSISPVVCKAAQRLHLRQIDHPITPISAKPRPFSSRLYL